MSDRAALLDAIIQNPDDDTPRWVYADWLDDNDKPTQAQFIRLSLEIADLESKSRTRRYNRRIKKRRSVTMDLIRELYANPYMEHWWPIRPWRPSVLIGDLWCKFHRGFIVKISGRDTDILAQCSSLYVKNPVKVVSVTHTGNTDHSCLSDLMSDLRNLLRTSIIEITGERACFTSINLATTS